MECLALEDKLDLDGDAFGHMIDAGIYNLKTASQLFRKLLKDYERVKACPDDSEAWLNFIVTADHLPEWESAGDEDKAQDLRETNPLLRIAHQLSINAKHFKARPRKVPPIARTHEGQTYTFDASKREVVPTHRAYWLELSEREATEIGRRDISSLYLAHRLVAFWGKRLGESY